MDLTNYLNHYYFVILAFGLLLFCPRIAVYLSTPPSGLTAAAQDSRVDGLSASISGRDRLCIRRLSQVDVRLVGQCTAAFDLALSAYTHAFWLGPPR